MPNGRGENLSIGSRPIMERTSSVQRAEGDSVRIVSGRVFSTTWRFVRIASTQRSGATRLGPRVRHVQFQQAV